MPYSNGTEQYIVDSLRDSEVLTLSLVAIVDQRIVGHIAISPIQISDGTDHWFGVGPVSVHPDLQRRGIGSLLINEALSQLKAQQAGGCVLLGDPAYYCRFGFAPISGLELPGVATPYFQGLAFSEDLPQGTVKYHKAFEENS